MAYYSDSHEYMGFPNDFNGNMFQREPTHFNSYANGYSHVVPRCHICGFEGHMPAECQQRNYSTQPCFDMNFAQQHGSYHNNYSDGWPSNQNMAYRDNSPPISLFPPSYQMQGFRCGEESQYCPDQHEAPTYAPEFNQDQQQFSAQFNLLAERSSLIEELKKQQQELRDEVMQLNEKISQMPTHEPQHQPQEPVPMELNDPPQVQSSEERFNDTEKLSLLCLEFNWSAEDDPLRPVIITEMKKIKVGKDLVEELKEIEKKMKLSNIVSSLLELELSAPVVPFDICEVPTPSHEAEQTSRSKMQAAAVAEEEAAESEKEERSQILEEQDPQLVRISEEQVETEDMELEIPEDMHIVIQELAEIGLPDPLDDMLASEFSTIVS